MSPTSSSKSSKSAVARTTSFPGIVDGWRQALEMVPKVVLPYLGLSLLAGFVTVLAIAVPVILFLVVNGGSVANFSELAANPMGPEMMRLWSTGGVAVVIGIVGVIILSTVFSVAMFQLFADAYHQRNISIASSLKKGWELLVPSLVVGLLTSVVIVGNMMLLLVPGIIVSIFLAFTSYALILDGMKGQAALRESVRLVRHNFWPLFGRFAVVVLALIVISVIVDSLFKGAGLVNMIVNFVTGLCLSAYGVVLYEQAKAASTGKPAISLKLFYILAVLGLVIFALTFGAIFRLAGESIRQGFMDGGTYDQDMMQSDYLETMPSELEGMENWEEQLPPEVLNSPEFQDTQRKLEQLMQDDAAARQMEEQNSLYAR